MIEKGPFENHHDGPEAVAGREAAAIPEARQEQVEQQAETGVKQHELDQARQEKQAREEIIKIHEVEPPRPTARTIRVPLHKLEPAIDTVIKTWGSIRQHLSPSQKTFSKVIHNPVVSSVSEFTAKTLARPYAILSGSVVAVAGSATYLYFTRHLGYKYNFFVPIILFSAGLAVGIIVEMVYKLVAKPHKR